MKSILFKLKSLSRYNNYLRPFLTLIAVSLLFNYILSNAAEFSMIFKISFFNLIILLIIKFLFVFSNSYFQKVSLKIIDTNINNFDSLKLTSRSMLMNQILPFKSGMGYRMFYLIKHYQIKVKEFGRLIYFFYLFNLLTIGIVIVIYQFFQNVKINNEETIYLIFLIFISSFIYFFISKKKNLFTSTTKIYFLKYSNLFFASILSNFLQFIFIAYSYYFFKNEKFIIDSLFHYIVHGVSSMVNITPGSIGLREGLLLYFQNYFSVDSFMILNIAILDRLSLLVALSIFNLFFKLKSR